MLTEAQGCAVLKRVFSSRGYKIQENVDFSEGTVKFNADGWDPKARVGYEYMTVEAGDHDDLSPDEMKQLGNWMNQGKLFFFIVDEANIEDEEELSWAANRFLDEVARRRGATP